jgi:xylulokinase
MLHIGLDIGTSGCKASAIDGEGRVARRSYRFYSTTSSAPGNIELDASTVYSSVKEALAEIAGPDIRAIAVASMGEAIVPLGANDEVLASSIYYSDIRGNEEVSDIKHAMDPKEILRITGMPVGPMFSAGKLLWLKKHEPTFYKSIKRKMLFGDFISFMLSGECVIDYSLASRTMLFDINAGEWSGEVADAIGLDVEGFSRPVNAGTVIGKIRTAVSDELGLPRETLIVAGGHDQVVAALGAGAVLPGETLDSMGSSECLTVVLSGCRADPLMTRYGFCCEPHVIPGAFVTLAFNASAGSAIKWYRDTFENERFGSDGEAHENAFATLDAEIDDEPTEILFLPYVSGSGTPWFDSKTGGAFIGLHQGTDRADIYKSVLEGISYEIKYNETLLEKCGMTFDAVVAAGGGSRSDKLMQIKADIMNRRIDVPYNHDISTTGLALICAKAMGEIDDLADAAKRVTKIVKSFEPDAHRVEHYARKLKEYRSVYTSIKSLSSMPSSDSGIRRS